MLDERGLDLSSEQLAELLGDAGNTVWNTKHWNDYWALLEIKIDISHHYQPTTFLY